MNQNQAEPAKFPARRIELLLFVVASILAWFALDLRRDRTLDGKLGSDEPEWIAMSILHWQQFTGDGLAAGADLEVAAQPSDTSSATDPSPSSPWSAGVQATTFGYMNPCLPKLLWGALFAFAGFREASPFAFQRFYAKAPARKAPAWDKLRPVEPLARQSVQALAAICAGLIALAARRSVAGNWGWLAAVLSLGLWIASPLVLRTAGVIRTDYFMLPWVLAGLVLALGQSAALAGGAGSGRRLWVYAWLGILGGLATSSKLNGALLLVCAGAWLASAWVVAPQGERLDLARRSLTRLLVCGALAFGVFFVLNPRLWSGPVDGVRDILARWDALITYFQDEWAQRTGVEVARNLPERLSLYARKTLSRDEPIGALTGSAWIGGAALAVGLVSLSWSALRANQMERTRHGILLVFALVFLLGTALWLPLDWERFYLTGLPALILLESVGITLAIRHCLLRRS